MSSASVQWVFCRSSSMCRCISTVSVGRKVISASYSSAILPRPTSFFNSVFIFYFINSWFETMYYFHMESLFLY